MHPKVFTVGVTRVVLACLARRLRPTAQRHGSAQAVDLHQRDAGPRLVTLALLSGQALPVPLALDLSSSSSSSRASSFSSSSSGSRDAFFGTHRWSSGQRRYSAPPSATVAGVGAVALAPHFEPLGVYFVLALRARRPRSSSEARAHAPHPPLRAHSERVRTPGRSHTLAPPSVSLVSSVSPAPPRPGMHCKATHPGAPPALHARPLPLCAR